MDWTTPSAPVGIEPLIDEIARHPNVDEVHVTEETRWTWTRHVVSDVEEDEGIRYGTTVALSIVATIRPGRETVVAHLLLGNPDRHDLITGYRLVEDESYSLVKIAAVALQ